MADTRKRRRGYALVRFSQRVYFMLGVACGGFLQYVAPLKWWGIMLAVGLLGVFVLIMTVIDLRSINRD